MTKTNWKETKVGNWKLDLKEKVPNSPQVEIRDGTGVVIVVSLGDGYKYRHYGKPRYYIKTDPLQETMGVNIHFALNGPLRCTFEEFEEIHGLILMARDKLVAYRLWRGSGKDGGFEGLLIESDGGV